jgi:hypothetical protein
MGTNRDEQPGAAPPPEKEDQIRVDPRFANLIRAAAAMKRLKQSVFVRKYMEPALRQAFPALAAAILDAEEIESQLDQLRPLNNAIRGQKKK